MDGELTKMNLTLFKDEQVIDVTNNPFKIVEDKIEIENFKMILDIEFSQKETSKYYHLAADGDEHSKIKFLSYNNFPDGVIIEKISKTDYKINVLELKRNAKNHLRKIPMQLHSGILHAISVIRLNEVYLDKKNKILDTNEVNITYELFICSGKKINQPMSTRMIPGQASQKITPLHKLVNSNIISHELKAGEIIDLPVRVIVFNEESSGNNEIYTAKITI